MTETSALRPRLALGLVVAEGFLGRLTFGMVSFALPLYALSLGLSLVEVGLLIGGRTVVALALKPVAGWGVDRAGVRAVYLAGTAARALAAAVLLLLDGPAAVFGLVAARVLQGASAAGRDVASLGVIARDAAGRIGAAYGLYASAKHVGGVAGAAVAGLLLAGAGGEYAPLFRLVLVLSLLPIGAAWLALREAPAAALDIKPEPAASDGAPGAAPASGPEPGTLALARELAGPATVGLLVASSAYMVHGLFPILATQHAGLSAAQTGLVLSLSAALFLVAGPAFGWLVDRFGHTVGLTWRAGANVGSSLLYAGSPTLAGLAAARSLDDSGKAAFRPAWAALVAGVAAADPPRRGRRLGLLEGAQTAGEALGPALAGILWHTGGVPLLFGVRVAIGLVAEVAALYVARTHVLHVRVLPASRGAGTNLAARLHQTTRRAQAALTASKQGPPVTPLTAQLDQADLETLETVVAAGYASTPAEAVRWALARVRERPAYEDLRRRLRDIECLETEF